MICGRWPKAWTSASPSILGRRRNLHRRLRAEWRRACSRSGDRHGRAPRCRAWWAIRIPPSTNPSKTAYSIARSGRGRPISGAGKYPTSWLAATMPRFASGGGRQRSTRRNACVRTYWVPELPRQTIPDHHDGQPHHRDTRSTRDRVTPEAIPVLAHQALPIYQNQHECQHER